MENLIFFLILSYTRNYFYLYEPSNFSVEENIMNNN